MGEALDLFVYTFAALGIAFVIGYSKLTLAFRDWLWKQGLVGKWLVTLMECPACLGFWIGLIVVLMHVDPLHLKADPFHVISFALYTCGICLYLGLRSGLISGGAAHHE